MKNKFLFILLTFIFLFVPLSIKAAEMKSIERQFQEEILSAFQNENTGIPNDMTYARYLQEEDGSKPAVLAFSMDYSTPYIPSPTNPSNGYNYVAVDNLINDDYGAGLQYIIQNGFKETSGYYVDNITYFKNQVTNKVTNSVFANFNDDNFVKEDTTIKVVEEDVKVTKNTYHLQIFSTFSLIARAVHSS